MITRTDLPSGIDAQVGTNRAGNLQFFIFNINGNDRPARNPGPLDGQGPIGLQPKTATVSPVGSAFPDRQSHGGGIGACPFFVINVIRQAQQVGCFNFYIVRQRAVLTGTVVTISITQGVFADLTILAFITRY